MTIHRAKWLAASALSLFVAGCATSIDAPTGAGGFGGETAGSGGAGGGVSDAGPDVSPDAAPGPCVQASDCPQSPDACNDAICINGMCGKTPANDFGACDDGLYCTDNDACMGGVCVGGTMKVCAPPDACHVGVCDEETKACQASPGNDGAQCDDMDACTGPGSCMNGACAKGQAVDCSVFDGQCTIGVCGANGCVPMPKNEGTDCDDGSGSPCTGGKCIQGMCTSQPINEGGGCNDNLFCTIGDHCESGACVAGGPNICAPPGGCYIGVCNEAMKSCTSAPGNDGAQCDDFNACTTGTTCLNGACINGQPTNEGGACDDGSGCTTGEFCTAGICGGGAGPTVYFADDFHDNSKGWQFDTEWGIGSATVSAGQVYGNPDPGVDHTPTADNGVAGVVIGGNASIAMQHGYYYLTSSTFNTQNAVGPVILGFYRWLNSDYDPFMHNSVDVWNGVSWINLWTSGGSPGVQDNAWTFVQHDLTQYKNAGMRIRFGFNITSGGVFTVSSWNIDDVLVASGACP